MGNILVLRQFTVEELKSELARRRTLDRAKIYLPSAERNLEKAQAKVEMYRAAVAEDSKASKVKGCPECNGTGIKPAHGRFPQADCFVCRGTGRVAR